MDMDHSKLRRAADYRNARRALRLAGTWSLLLGGFSIALGSLWSPVDWVLTALGAALLGTGVWNMRAPRPTGIVLDAIMLLLVGGYGLIGAVLAVFDGLPPAPHLALLGVFQVVSGIRRLGTLGQFADAFLQRPPDSDAGEIEQTIWAVRRALSGGATGVIEFTASGVYRRPWKARFAGEHAIFVELAGPGLIVGARSTVTIVPLSDATPGPICAAELACGGTRLRIALSADALRAYEQWKSVAPVARPVAA